MLSQIAGTAIESVINGQTIRFFVTNPNDAIMAHHYRGVFYEKEELTIIQSHYKGSGAFLDLGANVGNHALYMSKFTSCPKIVVFEPNPEAYDVLKLNMLLNNCQNVDMRHLGIALSDAESWLSLTDSPENNLGGTWFEIDPAGAVLAVPGDSLVSGYPVEFIKIDVERMEYAVLRGLKSTIQRWRPNIFIEVWNSERSSFDRWITKNSYEIIDQYQRYEGIDNFMITPRTR